LPSEGCRVSVRPPRASVARFENRQHHAMVMNGPREFEFPKGTSRPATTGAWTCAPSLARR
jgi:hypothetical protein